MPRTPMPLEMSRFLTRPNHATISCRPDGAPVRVSLSAVDPEGWIAHVSLQGRVDRIATHCTGRPYRVRDRPRVTARIEVDRWHGWGRLREAT